MILFHPNKNIMPNTALPSLRCLPLLRSARGILVWILFAHGSAALAQNQPADVNAIGKRVAPCMTCHGKEGRATSDGYYPRIAGKPAGYLYNQLLNFREGRRQQYPLMIYMVQHLSDAYLKEMATYFAAQRPPYPPPQVLNVTRETLERGRQLTINGDATRGIPPCVACHGTALTGVAPFIPGLLGIPHDYINAQFGAWRQGVRRALAPDCMAKIAQQLSIEEINAVSAWLASQPVPADSRPAASLPAPLPLDCGGVAHRGEG